MSFLNYCGNMFEELADRIANGLQYTNVQYNGGWRCML